MQHWRPAIKVRFQFNSIEIRGELYYDCGAHKDLSGDYYPAADYEALEAKLNALLVGLQVREIEDLKTKTPEHFAKIAECIADDSQEKAAKIMHLEANLARLELSASRALHSIQSTALYKELKAAIDAVKVTP